jgi:23S rRNA (uracil1939-C5)-methyltransferase
MTAPENTQDPLLEDPLWAAGENAARKPRQGDRVLVRPDRLGPKGELVGQVGAYSVEVDHGVLGSTLLVEVRRRRREWVTAHTLEQKSPSPWHVAARCPHTRDCGGCRLQELDYGQQLIAKHGLAAQQLQGLDLAAQGWPKLPPVQPAPLVDGYRNKMDFTFGDRRWLEHNDDGRATDFALGLHARGSWSKVLDVKFCALAFAGAERLLASIRDLARELGLEPYATQRHSGFLRHVLLRCGTRTGELLVDLVTREREAPGFEALWRGLLARHPEITTLVQNINSRPATVAIGEAEYCLFGPGYVHEVLAGRRFRISANSFFQTNTTAAEGLVQHARRVLARHLPQVQVHGQPTCLYDLYCGGGTFALTLADLFDEVVGLELVPSAIADARHNAALNGLDNVRFEVGDVLALLPPELAAAQGRPEVARGSFAGSEHSAEAEFAGTPEARVPLQTERGARPPTVVLVDPPRAGLHADVTAALLAARPPLLAYVACHLPSAGRDFSPFLAAGYRLLDLALFDLFPHTPHLEGFFLLGRSG